MADANEEVLDPELLEGGEGQDDEAELEHQGDLEGEDEVLVSFDGEGAPAQGEGQDSGLVRHLREQLRETQRENRELKKQAPGGVPQVEVGEKPTLMSCDYDEDRFERELDEWRGRKAQAERQEQDRAQAEQAQQAAWQKRLGALETQKGELGVRDYEQAAEEVRTTFPEAQQALIVRYSENPAKMIYALGRSPAKAAELAKISDPGDFIAALAKLEGKTTVTTQRKTAPDPEKVARGSAPLSTVDRQEQRLEAEAAKTGNYTKLFAYRRQKRARG